MLASAVNNYWLTWFPGALLATASLGVLTWKGVVRLVESRRTIKQLGELLPMIAAEFNPNHGSSMKDRVEALHTKQDQLSYDTRKWQREHARDDDRRFERLDAGLERIEDKLTP